MLTPAFELSQDAEFVVIVIKAPYAKVSDADIFIEDCDFKFHSKPYYLRLTLPKPLVEDHRASAKYEADTGQFVVRVPKAQPGETFEGLDMLTKLLAPSGDRSAKAPGIEVLDNTRVDENVEDQDVEDEEFDWQIEQQPFCEEEEEGEDVRICDAPKYGFANQRSAVLARLQSELQDLIDLKDADSVPAKRRRTLRLQHEQAHFDEDYYLCDLYQTDGISDLLDYVPVWVEEYSKLKGGDKAEDVVIFTEEEKEQMRNLPRKEYVLDQVSTYTTLLGLVDLIYAYAYNHRTTEGESTVESAWTICKLSSTLSWLESFGSLQEVLVACLRRSLCYPLYRHWKVSQRVLRDVWRIFSVGQRRLVKCLLEMRRLLQQADPYYILNDLYITDYCVWIQSLSEKQILSVAKKLKEVKIQRQDVGLDLEVLEEAASLAVAEEQQTNEVSQHMASLTVSQSGSEVMDDAANRLTAQFSNIAVIEPEAKQLEKDASCSDTKEPVKRSESPIDGTTCPVPDKKSKGEDHGELTSSVDTMSSPRRASHLTSHSHPEAELIGGEGKESTLNSDANKTTVDLCIVKQDTSSQEESQSDSETDSDTDSSDTDSDDTDSCGSRTDGEESKPCVSPLPERSQDMSIIGHNKSPLTSSFDKASITGKCTGRTHPRLVEVESGLDPKDPNAAIPSRDNPDERHMLSSFTAADDSPGSPSSSPAPLGPLNETKPVPDIPLSECKDTRDDPHKVVTDSQTLNF